MGRLSAGTDLWGFDSRRHFEICCNGGRASPPEVIISPEPLATQKVKQLFRDFTYTDLEGGRVRIDPAWVAENLVPVKTPQLAAVTSTGGRIPFHKKAALQLGNAIAMGDRV